MTLTQVDQKQSRVVCLLLTGDICINMNKSEVEDRHVIDVNAEEASPQRQLRPRPRKHVEGRCAPSLLCCSLSWMLTLLQV